ncbi:MAG: hypothetical protein ACKVQR_07500 [Aquabacterium sp.]
MKPRHTMAGLWLLGLLGLSACSQQPRMEGEAVVPIAHVQALGFTKVRYLGVSDDHHRLTGYRACPDSPVGLQPFCIDPNAPQFVRIEYNLRTGRWWLDGWPGVPPIPPQGVPPQLRRAYDIANPDLAGVCCAAVTSANRLP